jgi:hypothetical protein
MKFIHAKLNGQMTERKQQRVNSILKQAGVNLSQVDQTEVWDEHSETSLEATFEFSVEDNQADRVSSEFRAIGFVVSEIEWPSTH